MSLFQVSKGESAVHITDDLSKSAVSSCLDDFQFPILSLIPAANEVDDNAKIDLNVPAQVTQLPPGLCLFPIASMASSRSIMSRPSSIIEPHFHLPLPDLELAISSPRSSEQIKSNPSSLLVGTIRVT